MDYIFLAIAVIGIGLQLVFTKLYQKKKGSSLPATLLFNALIALFSLVVFFIISGFKIQVNAFSIILALVLAIIFSCNGIFSIKICSMGSIAVYTLFLMLGGMLLPFIYGVAFLKEDCSVSRIIAMILIAFALVLQFVGANKDNKHKNSFIFYLFCSLIFISNGLVGVVSKMHQDPSVFEKINMTITTASTNEFLTWTYIFMTVLNGAFLGIYMLSKKLKHRADTKLTDDNTMSDNSCSVQTENQIVELSQQKKSKAKDFAMTLLIVFLGAVFSSVGYFMQLLGAKNLDASLLYPIVTGGTILISGLFGYLFFKEVPDKFGIISCVVVFIATILFVF